MDRSRPRTRPPPGSPLSEDEHDARPNSLRLIEDMRAQMASLLQRILAGDSSVVQRYEDLSVRLARVVRQRSEIEERLKKQIAVYSAMLQAGNDAVTAQYEHYCQQYAEFVGPDQHRVRIGDQYTFQGRLVYIISAKAGRVSFLYLDGNEAGNQSLRFFLKNALKLPTPGIVPVRILERLAREEQVLRIVDEPTTPGVATPAVRGTGRKVVSEPRRVARKLFTAQGEDEAAPPIQRGGGGEKESGRRRSLWSVLAGILGLVVAALIAVERLDVVLNPVPRLDRGQALSRGQSTCTTSGYCLALSQRGELQLMMGPERHLLWATPKLPRGAYSLACTEDGRLYRILKSERRAQKVMWSEEAWMFEWRMRHLSHFNAGGKVL